MIKKILFCLFSLCIVFNAKSQTIEVATLEWPPFNDSSKDNGGFLTQIVHDSFQKVNIDIKVIFMPWSRVLDSAAKGEIDCFMPAYDSDERRKTHYFSDALYKIPVGFAKRKDSKNILYKYEKNLNLTYDSIVKQKLKVGITKGYINEHLFDKRNDIIKISYGTDEQLVKSLINKHVDLIIIDNVAINYILEKSFTEQANEVEFLTPALEEKSVFLLFPKIRPESQKLSEKFNKGYELLKKEKKPSYFKINK